MAGHEQPHAFKLLVQSNWHVCRLSNPSKCCAFVGMYDGWNSFGIFVVACTCIMIWIDGVPCKDWAGPLDGGHDSLKSTSHLTDAKKNRRIRLLGDIA
jgi:hypothetical protein